MAQDYDKIIKEIFRNSIIAFMTQITGENFEPISNLDPKLQKTIEREADFFKIVQRKRTNRKEVLHVEWQLKTTWKKMRNRMLFYKVLGIEITNLPVKQYVLYLGKGRPKVDTTFKNEDMDYRYHLICIKDIDYHQLLNAPDTNTALFAILADFGKDAPEYVIEQIGERMLKEN
ncbi:MAG: hypothetical protein AB8G86_20225 [Saprospiraceae bacterium]